MGNIKQLKYWAFKVLPLAYDDSLSYYEVVNKVVTKLNELVTETNKLPEYISKEIEKQLKGNGDIYQTLFSGLINAIATDEGDVTFTPNQKQGGEIFWLNGKLYEAVQEMAEGTNYIIGTNIVPISINQTLDEIKNYISTHDEYWHARSTNNHSAQTYMFWKDELYRVDSDIKINDIIGLKTNGGQLVPVNAMDEITAHYIEMHDADNNLQTQIDENDNDIDRIQTEVTTNNDYLNNRIDNIVAQAGTDNTEVRDARTESERFGVVTDASLRAAIVSQINKTLSSRSIYYENATIDDNYQKDIKITHNSDGSITIKFSPNGLFRNVFQGSLDRVLADESYTIPNNSYLVWDYTDNTFKVIAQADLTKSNYGNYDTIVFNNFGVLHGTLYYWQLIEKNLWLKQVAPICFLAPPNTGGIGTITFVSGVMNWTLPPSGLWILVPKFGRVNIKSDEVITVNNNWVLLYDLHQEKFISTEIENMWKFPYDRVYLGYVHYGHFYGPLTEIFEMSRNKAQTLSCGINKTNYQNYLYIINDDNSISITLGTDGLKIISEYLPTTVATFGSNSTITIKNNEALCLNKTNNQLESVGLGIMIANANIYFYMGYNDNGTLIGAISDSTNYLITKRKEDAINNPITLNRIADSIPRPMQSLAGYKYVVASGITNLLCDLRYTADNVAICAHDSYPNEFYNNVYDNSGKLVTDKTPYSELTYDYIRTNYDYGLYRGDAYKGTRILTLKDFLTFCSENDCTPWIEAKTGSSLSQFTAWWDVAIRYGLDEKLIFNSTNVASLTEVVSYAPRIKFGCDIYDSSQVDVAINNMKNYNFGKCYFIYTPAYTLKESERNKLLNAGLRPVYYYAGNDMNELINRFKNNTNQCRMANVIYTTGTLIAKQARDQVLF